MNNKMTRIAASLCLLTPFAFAEEFDLEEAPETKAYDKYIAFGIEYWKFETSFSGSFAQTEADWLVEDFGGLVTTEGKKRTGDIYGGRLVWQFSRNSALEFAYRRGTSSQEFQSSHDLRDRGESNWTWVVAGERIELGFGFASVEADSIFEFKDQFAEISFRQMIGVLEGINGYISIGLQYHEVELDVGTKEFALINGVRVSERPSSSYEYDDWYLFGLIGMGLSTSPKALNANRTVFVGAKAQGNFLFGHSDADSEYFYGVEGNVTFFTNYVMSDTVTFFIDLGYRGRHFFSTPEFSLATDTLHSIGGQVGLNIRY